MTLLVVAKEDDPTGIVLRSTDAAEIAGALAAVGVRFEQWPTRDAGADPLATYAPEIARLVTEGGYVAVDVVRLAPTDDADWPARAAGARAKFLTEHTHAEDEVRFFVEGRGAFYLRLAGRVYALVCETGDLVSVPAGTRHWFDMGRRPLFCALRFFRTPDGWVGAFTGDTIALRFPTFDELVA